MAFVLVFLGGGVGAASRYLTTLWISSLWAGQFPLGTFVVNLVGCFLVGALAGFSERLAIEANAKLVLQTGFLGGFTTFSAFGIETIQLFQRGESAQAWGYVVASNVLGIGMVFVGFLLTKSLFTALPKDK